MNRRSTPGPRTAAPRRFAWHTTAHGPLPVRVNKPRSEAISAGHEKVPPVGFEPTHTAPEAVALSPELWGLSVPHTLGPAPERGEPSGAEWTQQHYQCAASSGQMTGTTDRHRHRHATGTRRAATGPRRKHIARARRPTRDGNARRCEEYMATGSRPKRERHPWYAAGTRDTRARPEPDKRLNFARCVAWSG